MILFFSHILIKTIIKKITKIKFNTQKLFDNNNVTITRIVYDVFIIAININNYVTRNNKCRNIVRINSIAFDVEINFKISNFFIIHKKNIRQKYI